LTLVETLSWKYPFKIEHLFLPKQSTQSDIEDIEINHVQCLNNTRRFFNILGRLGRKPKTYIFFPLYNCTLQRKIPILCCFSFSQSQHSYKLSNSELYHDWIKEKHSRNLGCTFVASKLLLCSHTFSWDQMCECRNLCLTLRKCVCKCWNVQNCYRIWKLTHLWARQKILTHYENKLTKNFRPSDIY
jgi:hypothetical protein